MLWVLFQLCQCLASLLFFVWTNGHKVLLLWSFICIAATGDIPPENLRFIPHFIFITFVPRFFGFAWSVLRVVCRLFLVPPFCRRRYARQEVCVPLYHMLVGGRFCRGFMVRALWDTRTSPHTPPPRPNFSNVWVQVWIWIFGSDSGKRAGKLIISSRRVSRISHACSCEQPCRPCLCIKTEGCGRWMWIGWQRIISLVPVRCCISRNLFHFAQIFPSLERFLESAAFKDHQYHCYENFDASWSQ